MSTKKVSLEEENEILKTVLKFYSESDNYTKSYHTFFGVLDSDVQKDGGALARRLLMLLERN